MLLPSHLPGLSYAVLFLEPKKRVTALMKSQGVGDGTFLRRFALALPFLLVVYSLVSSFALIILLPCVFVLLVVRTTK